MQSNDIGVCSQTTQGSAVERHRGMQSNDIGVCSQTHNKDISINNNSIIDNSINIKENIIKEIINYLNLQIGTKYSYKNKKTQSLINARFKENNEYTVDDFFLVIDKKVKEWKGTEMEKYLRPETLFGTKFENYLNQNESVSKQAGHKEDMFEQLDRVFREVENERIN